MINRLMSYLGGPEGEEPQGEYWEVMGENVWYCVSRETALEVSSKLARIRPPRWLRFRDLFGAEVHVRSRDVIGVAECTAEQRAAGRAFRRARRLEEKADRRPWEDED